MSEKLNPLRFCISGEAKEITDRLLDEFLLTCIGKNDMAVVNAFLASAAVMIAAHCEHTDHEFRDLAKESIRNFALALQVAGEKAGD